MLANILFLLAGAIIAVVLIIIFNPAAFWQKVAGNPDMGTVDFVTLRGTTKPNQFLMCPEGLCENRKPDAISPRYAVSKERLKALFLDVMEDEKHEITEDKGDVFRFITRSPMLGFPDTNSVEFMAAEGGSSLAIYARAQVGYSDLGKNEERVKRLIDALNKKTSPLSE